jgi:hypothetical protein
MAFIRYPSTLWNSQLFKAHVKKPPHDENGGFSCRHAHRYPADRFCDQSGRGEPPRSTAPTGRGVLTTVIADATTLDVMAVTVAVATHIMRTGTATRAGDLLDIRRRGDVRLRHGGRCRFGSERDGEKGCDQER